MLQGSMCDVLETVRITASFMAWATLRMELPSAEIEMVWEKVLGAVLSSEIRYRSRRWKVGRWVYRSGSEQEIWTRDNKLGSYQHSGCIFKPC